MSENFGPQVHGLESRLPEQSVLQGIAEEYFVASACFNFCICTMSSEDFVTHVTRQICGELVGIAS
jgi:hypothetical protein